MSSQKPHCWLPVVAVVYALIVRYAPRFIMRRAAELGQSLTSIFFYYSWICIIWCITCWTHQRCRASGSSLWPVRAARRSKAGPPTSATRRGPPAAPRLQRQHVHVATTNCILLLSTSIWIKLIWKYIMFFSWPYLHVMHIINRFLNSSLSNLQLPQIRHVVFLKTGNSTFK